MAFQSCMITSCQVGPWLWSFSVPADAGDGAQELAYSCTLQLMHSQMTDSAAPSGMDAEATTLRLLLATQSTSGQAEVSS